MCNTTLGPFEPQPFEPPPTVVVVNILLFLSLVIILIAVFISILVKVWIRVFDRGLKSIPVMKDRVTVREYRTQVFQRYQVSQIVALLPLLIYISLILFACGLVVLLRSVHPPSAIAIRILTTYFLYQVTLRVRLYGPRRSVWTSIFLSLNPHDH